MPLAQKRGSVSAPGICARNSGLNSPHTVETLTPTFSNTRPRITLITPPPPPGRGHAVRHEAAGGGRLRTGQRVLDRLERGAEPVAQALEPCLRGLFQRLVWRRCIGLRHEGLFLAQRQVSPSRRRVAGVRERP